MRKEPTKELDETAKAFMEKLFNENYYRLLAYVLNNLAYRNFMIAEDIVQSIFLEAIRKYDVLKDHPNPNGWLTRTGNLKIRMWRRKGSTGEASLDAMCVEKGRVDAHIAAAEIQVVIDSVLNEKERELFEAFFIKRISARELAARENITRNSFSMKLYRIRDRVRRQLENDC